MVLKVGAFMLAVVSTVKFSVNEEGFTSTSNDELVLVPTDGNDEEFIFTFPFKKAEADPSIIEYFIRNSSYPLA